MVTTTKISRYNCEIRANAARVFALFLCCAKPNFGLKTNKNGGSALISTKYFVPLTRLYNCGYTLRML